MKKTLIAAGIAAVVAAPAFADTTVYGQANVSIDNLSYGSGGEANDKDFTVVDRASRLGFKGSEDLGNGMTAVYGMEFDADLADGTEDTTGSAALTSRNMYVGLKGGFGTFVAGRHDVPEKMIQKADMFADTAADQSAYVNETRANQAIAYITPTVNGVHGAVALVGGDKDGAAASSYALVYKNGGLYAAIGGTNFDAVGSTKNASVDTRTLSVTYTMGDIKVSAQRQEQDADGTSSDEDVDLIGIAYKMGNNTLKAQYLTNDSNTNSSDADVWTVGIDHAFSKRTSVYALYSDKDIDTSTSTDVETLSFGLKHKF